MTDRGPGVRQGERIGGGGAAAGSLRVLWLTPAYPWASQPVTGSFYRTQAAALARREPGSGLARLAADQLAHARRLMESLANARREHESRRQAAAERMIYCRARAGCGAAR